MAGYVFQIIFRSGYNNQIAVFIGLIQEDNVLQAQDSQTAFSRQALYLLIISKVSDPDKYQFYYHWLNIKPIL